MSYVRGYIKSVIVCLLLVILIIPTTLTAKEPSLSENSLPILLNNIELKNGNFSVSEEENNGGSKLQIDETYPPQKSKNLAQTSVEKNSRVLSIRNKVVSQKCGCPACRAVQTHPYNPSCGCEAACRTCESCPNLSCHNCGSPYVSACPNKDCGVDGCSTQILGCEQDCGNHSKCSNCDKYGSDCPQVNCRWNGCSTQIMECVGTCDEHKNEKCAGGCDNYGNCQAITCKGCGISIIFECQGSCARCG